MSDQTPQQPGWGPPPGPPQQPEGGTPQQPGWGPPPGPPQNGAPPPAPQKKRSGAFKAGFLGCFGVLAAVVVVIIVVAVIASSGSKSTTNTPAAGDNEQATATTAAGGGGKPAGTVLLSITGSGTKTTKKFSAAGDWDLVWAYDCSSFGQQGNFIVSINADDPLSGAALLSPVNQLGKKDAGVEHYHSGGNGIWLEINSECSWSVKASVA
jgi:hypothetical protein